MTTQGVLIVTQSGNTARITLVLMLLIAVILAATPWLFGIGGSGRAVALLVYILLAVMWNALAGFAGLISIGQTLFFGVAAYTTVWLATEPTLPVTAAWRPRYWPTSWNSEEKPMQTSLLTGGQYEAAANNRTYERCDPVTGEVATTVSAASTDDALRAARAAASAYPAWSATGPGERRTLLMKAADALEGMSEQIIQSMISETGATGPWGGFNCMLGAGILREAAAMTTQITGEVIPANKPGTLSMAQRKSLGVCLGIAPWNAPVILGVRAVAMAIACGNTAILKSSELCPATHMAIGEAFKQAGFPDGVMNVISNAPEDAADIVAALIAAPEIRHINFTGSTEVGRIIAMKAAEQLKPVLLELGGKAPLVILDDADIEAAVNGATFGSFMNQGQICMSTERVIVQEGIADEAQMPFGGVKNSGYGRFGGKAAIDSFSSVRWVTIEDSHQHFPF